MGKRFRFAKVVILPLQLLLFPLYFGYLLFKVGYFYLLLYIRRLKNRKLRRDTIQLQDKLRRERHSLQQIHNRNGLEKP